MLAGQTGLISLWISKHWPSPSEISVPDTKQVLISPLCVR